MPLLHSLTTLLSLSLLSLSTTATASPEPSPSAEPSPKVVQFDIQRHEVPRRRTILPRDTAEVPIHLEENGAIYVVNVTVGSPPQQLELLLDTGSSDTWIPWTGFIACRQQICNYGSFDVERSRSFAVLSEGTFEISYVDGTNVQGSYISETMGMGNVQLQNFTMGLVTDATDLGPGLNFPGLMGVGYDALESIAQRTNGRTVYPAMVSSLKDAGHINVKAYSLWLNDDDAGKGSILFGGIDTEKYQGKIAAVPLMPNAAGEFDRFNVVLDTFNLTKDSNIIYSKPNFDIAVNLDSGSTLSTLPDDIAFDLIAGLRGVYDERYEMAFVPCNIAASGAKFQFVFGDANGPVVEADLGNFALPIKASRPVTFRNGDEACRFGIQPALGRPNILGDTFLRSAYVVYNMEAHVIGIANTKFNSTKSNIKQLELENIPGASYTASGNKAAQTATRTGLFPGQTALGTFALGDPTGTAPFNLNAAMRPLEPPSRGGVMAVVVTVVAFMCGVLVRM